MDRSTPGPSVPHRLPEFAHTRTIESVLRSVTPFSFGRQSFPTSQQ